MKRVINVPDIHCENCVKRITNALTAAKLDFSVSLENKIVTVEGCEGCLNTALKEIEDLGFTPSVSQTTPQ